MQEVFFGPDGRRHLGHKFFANPVKRGIGDLCEELLEIVIKQACPVRQHGERGICPHRAYRLEPVGCHGCHQHPQLFVRVTKRLLSLQQCVLVRAMYLSGARQVLKSDQIFFQPVRVGIFLNEFSLDFFIVNDPALLGIDHENAARMQPVLDQDVFGWNFQHTHFRSHHDHVILGHVVAGRPQAIAVQHGTDDLPVRKGDRGRTIPWFHQAGVVFVECLAVRIHGFMVAPCLGNHHQDGMRQRPPAHVQKFQHVVEGRRVTAIFNYSRKNLLQVIAEQF